MRDREKLRFNKVPLTIFIRCTDKDVGGAGTMTMFPESYVTMVYWPSMEERKNGVRPFSPYPQCPVQDSSAIEMARVKSDDGYALNIMKTIALIGRECGSKWTVKEAEIFSTEDDDESEEIELLALERELRVRK